MNEVWKSIPKHPGYEVSNIGRVRSFKKRGKGGWFISSEPQRILKQTLSSGYPYVMLGRNTPRRVHHLVLEAFVGPCPDGMIRCHNDDNKDNNHIDNLRYDTPKGNTQDIFKNNGWALSKRGAQKICQLVKNGKQYPEIAEMLNMSINLVSRVATGKSYKPYTIDKNTTREIKRERNKEIRKLYSEGWKLWQIAEKFNLSESGISRIVNLNRGSMWEDDLENIIKPERKNMPKRSTEIENLVKVQGILNQSYKDDQNRIFHLDSHFNGGGIETVRELIDCHQMATKTFGHYSLMSKVNKDILEKIKLVARSGGDVISAIEEIEKECTN